MNALQLSNFSVTRDDLHVIRVVMHVAELPVNVFNDTTLQELETLLSAVEQDSTVKAVVFRSGKAGGFSAGADLHAVEAFKSAKEAEAFSLRGQQLFQRLESLAVPTIAVIQGACLGGGFEFALACHQRIVVDDPRTKLGLPEIELGLLPCWGGTQRLPMRIGRISAMTILGGKQYGAAEIYRMRLADAICKPDEIDNTLAKLVENSVRDVQTPANKSDHFPAFSAIRTAVAAGLRDHSDRGYTAERHEFGRLAMTDTHRSLLGLFFQQQRTRKLETWVPEIKTKPRPIRKIGVVGGGIMGAGIAHWARVYDYDVVLIEADSSRLEASVNRIRQRFDESVRRQGMPASDADAKLNSIIATMDWNALADVDLVVEAVPEDLSLKQSVFRDLEKYCPSHAILATNTSAMSIATIAKTNRNPNRVLGLHFFNPVHRMQLVEIIRPAGTRDEDVAQLIEFIKKLDKIPVVAADSPGFIVSRILYPYLDEAIRLNLEGVPTELIDREIRQFGMPMGPLELLDQIGIDVSARIADTVEDLCPEPSPAGTVLREMAAQGNIGRKSGRGFYDYPDGRKGKGRDIALASRSADISSEVIRDRLMLRMANEAARCLEERVVSQQWMIDLAMVLGTGFCPFLGGPLRMCELNGYDNVVAKLAKLEKTAGRRFGPSQWLIDQQLRAAK